MTVIFRIGILAVFLAAACLVSPAADAAKPGVPANLPPLPDNWKQVVYDDLTKNLKQKAVDTTKYLFLGTPVPCVVTQSSKIIFSPAKKYFQGYGGLVARRSKGLVFEGDRLTLYLLDGQGKLMFLEDNLELLGFYAVEPPLYLVTSKTVGKSTTTSFIPLVDRVTLGKLVIFRKAKLADLPAYE